MGWYLALGGVCVLSASLALLVQHFVYPWDDNTKALEDKVTSVADEVRQLSATLRSFDMSEETSQVLTVINESAKGLEHLIRVLASRQAKQRESLDDLIKQVSEDYGYQRTVEELPNKVILDLVEAIVQTHKRRGQLRGDEDTRASAVADEVRQHLSALTPARSVAS